MSDNDKAVVKKELNNLEVFKELNEYEQNFVINMNKYTRPIEALREAKKASGIPISNSSDLELEAELVFLTNNKKITSAIEAVKRRSASQLENAMVQTGMNLQKIFERISEEEVYLRIVEEGIETNRSRRNMAAEEGDAELTIKFSELELKYIAARDKELKSIRDSLKLVKEFMPNDKSGSNSNGVINIILGNGSLFDEGNEKSRAYAADIVEREVNVEDIVDLDDLKNMEDLESLKETK